MFDRSQQSVIELPEKTHAVVLGAPGTGKTHVVLESIEYRIQQRSYLPEEVLTLCPTRVGAKELRKKFLQRLAVSVSQPIARSIASIAFEICGQKSARENAAPIQLLTGNEQDVILADILQGHIVDNMHLPWPKVMGPAVRALAGFRSQLREFMARCLELGYSPYKLRQLGEMHKKSHWIAASYVFEEYNAILDFQRPNHRDVNELILEAANEVAKQRALTRTRVVFFDDAQDMSASGLYFLQACAKQGISVIACGDPDVSTATFRGANVYTLGQFQRFLGAPVTECVLEHAHRHTPEARALVNAVTERIGSASAGKQRKAAGARQMQDAQHDQTYPKDSIVSAIVPSAAAQAAYIAKTLQKKHVSEQIRWDRMVVVSRSHASLPELARILAFYNIPTFFETPNIIFAKEPVCADLLLLLDIGTRQTPPNVHEITRLLLGPLINLDKISLRRLRLALRRESEQFLPQSSVDELFVEAMCSTSSLATLDVPRMEEIVRLPKMIDRARKYRQDAASVDRILGGVWEESQLASLWQQQSLMPGIVGQRANRNLDSVISLFSSAERFVTNNPDRPAADFIATTRASQIPEDNLYMGVGQGVALCTVNATVGKEYDVVVVLDLQDGVWPNNSNIHSLFDVEALQDSQQIDSGTQVINAKKHQLDTELRLFACAVSRSRKYLVLCAINNEHQSPSPLMTKLVWAFTQPFSYQIQGLTLRTLVGQLRRIAVSGHSEGEGEYGQEITPSDAVEALAYLSQQNVPGSHPSTWYGVNAPSTQEPLFDLEDERTQVSISPSRIEACEESSFAWFLDAVTTYEADFNAKIGTLAHAVFENEKSIAKPHNPQALWEMSQAAWEHIRFDAQWVQERERRNFYRILEGIAQYMSDTKKDGKILLETEKKCELKTSQFILRGSFDRIEREGNGSLWIVDLKTGKTIPSQTLMEEHAQLLAYQFMLKHELLNQESPQKLAGAKLLFVRKGVRGKLYQERIQSALSEAKEQEFQERLQAMLKKMSANFFEIATELGEHDKYSSYRYRLHAIGEVSQ